MFHTISKCSKTSFSIVSINFPAKCQIRYLLSAFYSKLLARTDDILEISVKSGKDSTSTLSLVTQRVRFKKTLQKSTLAFNRG